ncbi:VIT family protein [soil metagenome]
MEVLKQPHSESHKSHRGGWLRASVLGVNDGLVSNASLMLGVFAASSGSGAVLTTGIAGLAAGAFSMAVGEYVSVSSQKDSEMSDIDIEKKSLAENPESELEELAWIYEQRGLDPTMARAVAEKLHEKDAVRAHARDELGIDNNVLARPTQAAVASALSFSAGALIPIIAAMLASGVGGAWTITITSLVALAISGAIGAVIGGGNKLRAALRVLLGGGLAMLATYYIGHIIGAAL